MIRVSTIAEGNPGIYQTVDRMLALIRQPSAWVASATVQALTPLTLEQFYSRHARAMLIFDWVQKRLVYTTDGTAPESLLPVPDIEELRSPEYLLRGIANAGVDYGDCDDFVILMASMLRMAKVPAALVITSAREDREFDHVFLRVETEFGPLYADAIHGRPFGWHVPAERVTAWQERSV